MKTILCYGDSNTWGADPVTGGRLALDVRWPGVMRASSDLDSIHFEAGEHAKLGCAVAQQVKLILG